MGKTIELVRQEVAAMRGEVEDFANSAERVGGVVSDVLEYGHEQLTDGKNKHEALAERVTVAEGRIVALEGRITEVQQGSNAAIEALAQYAGEIDGNVAAETERAQAAELENRQKIEAEVVRAKGAEEANAKAIGDEVARAEEAEASLTEDVGVISGDLENEIQRAQAAEQALGTEITEAENRVDERVTEVRDNLEAEVQARSEAVADLNANTGISEYPAFDPAVDYAVGDVVVYEGRLRRFVAEHAAGEWNAEQVEEWSERKGIKEDIGLDLHLERGQIDSTGSNSEYNISTRLRTACLIEVLGQAKLSTSGDIVYYWYAYDKSGNFLYLNEEGVQSATFDASSSPYLRFVFKKKDGDKLLKESVIIESNGLFNNQIDVMKRIADSDNKYAIEYSTISPFMKYATISSTGELSNPIGKKRAVIDGFFAIRDNARISVNDGFQFYYYLYDNNKSFIRKDEAGLTDSVIILEKGSYIRITIRKIDNSEFDFDDVKITAIGLMLQPNAQIQSLITATEENTETIKTEVNRAKQKEGALQAITDSLGDDINGNYVQGVSIDSTGEIISNDGWNLSEYIPYEQGNDIVWTYGIMENQYNAQLALFDKNKNRLTGKNSSDASGQRIILASDSELNGVAFLRASFHDSAKREVVISTGNTVFSPVAGLRGELNDNRYELNALFADITPWQPDSADEGYSNSETGYGRDTSREDWTAENKYLYYEFLEHYYDNYIIETSDYKVSKKGLWQSGQCDGHEVFEYDFCPLNYKYTIMLSAGMNANETQAIWGLATFIRCLMNEEEPNMSIMKKNIRFKVIPIINAAGFDTEPKLKYGYVESFTEQDKEVNPNFNFNFKDSWARQTATWAYKGLYPDSCIESRGLKAWINDNSGKAIFWIDMHTGRWEDNTNMSQILDLRFGTPSSYFSAFNSVHVPLIKAHYVNLGFIQETDSIGVAFSVRDNLDYQKHVYAMDICGIPSVMPEMHLEVTGYGADGQTNNSVAGIKAYVLQIRQLIMYAVNKYATEKDIVFVSDRMIERLQNRYI